MSMDEEKDLDTSLETEKLSNNSIYNNSDNSSLNKINSVSETDTQSDGAVIVPEPDNEAADYDKNLVESRSTGTDPIQLYDNDLAYELQQWGVNLAPSDAGSQSVASWSDIPKGDNEATNKNDDDSGSNVVSWCGISVPPDKTVAQDRNGDTSTDGGKNQEKNKAKVEFGRDRPLSETEKHDKQMKKQIKREKTRVKELEMVTSMVSPRGPMLLTKGFDNINLGKKKVSTCRIANRETLARLLLFRVCAVCQGILAGPWYVVSKRTHVIN